MQHQISSQTLILPITTELLSTHFAFRKPPETLNIEDKLQGAEQLLNQGVPNRNHALFLIDDAVLFHPPTTQPQIKPRTYLSWIKETEHPVIDEAYRKFRAPLQEDLYLILKTYHFITSLDPEQAPLFDHSTDSTKAYMEQCLSLQVPRYQGQDQERRPNQLIWSGPIPATLTRGIFVNSTDSTFSSKLYERHLFWEERRARKAPRYHKDAAHKVFQIPESNPYWHHLRFGQAALEPEETLRTAFTAYQQGVTKPQGQNGHAHPDLQKPTAPRLDQTTETFREVEQAVHTYLHHQTSGKALKK